MSIASNKRRVFGIKIPDMFLRNDDDDATTGQLTISKAGTVGLALSGSDADILLSGSQAQVILSGDTPAVRLQGAGAKLYLSNPGGTVGTISIGAGNVLILEMQATVGTVIDV